MKSPVPGKGNLPFGCWSGMSKELLNQYTPFLLSFCYPLELGDNTVLLKIPHTSDVGFGRIELKLSWKASLRTISSSFRRGYAKIENQSVAVPSYKSCEPHKYLASKDIPNGVSEEHR